MLCHKPDATSIYYRAGSAQSYVMAHGKHERMERPRVRKRGDDGRSREVSLRSWKLAQCQDDWEAAMMRATLCGVSTRSIPSLRESEAARESRSSISRLWQEKSAALVEQVQDSDLSDFNLVVLMLDAVILSDGLVATVALGISTDGQKADESFNFRWSSIPGARFELERSTNLQNWTPTGEFIYPDNTWTESCVPIDPQKNTFYRVLFWNE